MRSTCPTAHLLAQPLPAPGTRDARRLERWRFYAEEHQALGVAYHAAEGSELWRSNSPTPSYGGSRLPQQHAKFAAPCLADTLARWIVRIDFSLIGEPARPRGRERRALAVPPACRLVVPLRQARPAYRHRC